MAESGAPRRPVILLDVDLTQILNLRWYDFRRKYAELRDLVGAENIYILAPRRLPDSTRPMKKGRKRGEFVPPRGLNRPLMEYLPDVDPSHVITYEGNTGTRTKGSIFSTFPGGRVHVTLAGGRPANVGDVVFHLFRHRKVLYFGQTYERCKNVASVSPWHHAVTYDRTYQGAPRVEHWCYSIANEVARFLQ